MSNNLHEPEFVGDSKNALGYFIVFSFVTLGAAFVLGGMFSPIFLPWLLDRAKEKAKQATTGTFEENYRVLKRNALLQIMTWFIIGWGLFIYFQMTCWISFF